MTTNSESPLRVPRVAFFTDSFHETNGVALTSREFARFAKEHFYPFLSVHAGPQTKFWKRGSFETFEIATSRGRLGLEHDLSFDLLFLRHLKELERHVRAFQADVIHVTGPGHVGMLGAILAQRLGIPLVASWHTNVHEFAGRRLARALDNLPAVIRHGPAGFVERRALDLAVRFYNIARMIFAPNPELCAMLAARCERPVHPMHRGIDCEHYHPRRRPAPSGKFVVGYVGRISAEKNVRILARVEELLLRGGVSNLEIHVVGEGSERPWLERHLERGTFFGVLKGDALADAYAGMDVLLFPSETDTFGNVVLEAAASGVPAVVSTRGGPKFLVEEGQTGFVVKDAVQFADAIQKLAATPGLRQAMSHEARNAALTRSWTAVFENVYARYRDARAQGLLRVPPRASLTGQTFRPRHVS